MGLKDFSSRSPRALVIGFPQGGSGIGRTGTRSVVPRGLSILSWSWDKPIITVLFWLSCLPNSLRRLKTKPPPHPPPRHDKLVTMQGDARYCSWALCLKPWAEVSLVNLILVETSLLFRYKWCSYAYSKCTEVSVKTRKQCHCQPLFHSVAIRLLRTQL